MSDKETDSIELVDVNEALTPHVQHIAVGINEGLRKQLISKSKEPHILTNTPADAHERFGNETMLDDWLKKGRIVHWLLGPNNDLAGVIWYGKSAPPADVPIDKEIDITFAIRIYDGYFGKGLAKPFMKQSLQLLEDFEQTRHKSLRGIWLRTKLDNEAAKAVYTKFGYEEVYRTKTLVYMLLSATKIASIIGE